MTTPVAIGYESEITVEPDAGGRPERVVKAYRTDHPCVAWLNERLARWYDPALALPVAQHEWAAYALLAGEGFVPEPLELRHDAVVIAWGGETLHARSRISAGEYRRQAQAILDAFERLRFRHNDLLERNVLVDDGHVRIIDFTLAEFGAVTLMDALPDPAWARPGEDHLLLDHLRSARRARRHPRQLIRRLTREP
jgi:RIO-like serine/threonine protein kinase